METLVYHYNPKTGEYLGSSTADESPLEPGVYLVPANATLIAPPDAGQHQVAVFDGKAWSLVPDYRGRKYWLADGTEHTIDSIGVGLPVDALDEKPLPPINERRSVQRNTLKTQRDALTAEPIDGFQVGRSVDRERIKDAAANWDLLGVESIEWILADNSTRAVTRDDLLSVIQQYGLREMQVFAQYNALCAELLESDEPESITWPY